MTAIRSWGVAYRMAEGYFGELVPGRGLDTNEGGRKRDHHKTIATPIIDSLCSKLHIGICVGSLVSLRAASLSTPTLSPQNVMRRWELCTCVHIYNQV